MATRLYFPSSGVPLVTPATWNFANQVNPLSLKGSTVKTDGTPMTTKLEATGTTAPIAKAMFRFVYGPMAAQTLAGSVKAQMRGLESTSAANASPAIAIKFVKPDGTDRAVLLAQTAADAETAGHEFSATSLTNQKFEDATETTPLTLSSQACLDGDYLVVEVGFRSDTTTTRNISLSYGNDNATDLPEDNTTTAANNPWIEFSQTLNFFQPIFTKFPGRERSPNPFPRTTPPFVPTTTNDVTLALSGVAATLAIGTLGALLSFGLSGQAGTGAVTLGLPTASVAMSGSSGTGQLGTEVPGFSFTLSGQSATGSVGTLQTSGANQTLVGVAGTSGLGTLTPVNAEATTGLSATSALGTIVPEIDGILVGQLGATGLGIVVSTGGVSDNVFDRPRVVRGPFPFPKEVPAFSVTGPPPSATLSGVQATCNVDNALVTISNTVALTGVGASAQAGLLQPGSPGSATLTGVVGTGQVGTPVPGITVFGVGVEGDGFIANIVPSRLTYDRPVYVTGPFPFLPSGMFQYREKARVVQGPPIGSSATVGLTGVSAVGGVGSLTVSVTEAFTGVAASTGTGNIIEINAEALSGVVATGSVGTLGFAQALVGTQGTGATGTETPNITVGLTGVVAAGQLGVLAAQNNSDVTIALGGLAAVGSVGTLTPVFSLAESGVAASSAVGTESTSDTVVLIGQSAQGSVGSPSGSGSGQASLSGLQATASLGTVLGIPSQTPLGQEGDGAAGTCTVASTVALYGVSAGTRLGSFHLDEGSILDIVGEYRRTLDFVGELE